MKNEIKTKIEKQFAETFDSGFFEKIKINENEIEFFGFRGEENEGLEADAWAEDFVEKINMAFGTNFKKSVNY